MENLVASSKNVVVGSNDNVQNRFESLESSSNIESSDGFSDIDLLDASFDSASFDAFVSDKKFNDSFSSLFLSSESLDINS